jgi:hypothetical protein
VLLAPGEASRYVVAAWASVLPPTFGFTAMAILASVVTRSSVAGIALPVAAAMGHAARRARGRTRDATDVPLLTRVLARGTACVVDPHYYAPVVTRHRGQRYLPRRLRGDRASGAARA